MNRRKWSKAFLGSGSNGLTLDIKRAFFTDENNLSGQPSHRRHQLAKVPGKEKN
jgi:hypothetical protein